LIPPKNLFLFIKTYLNKQIMKNVIKVALPFALALAVSACGNKEESNKDNLDHAAMEHQNGMMENHEAMDGQNGTMGNHKAMAGAAGHVLVKDDKLNAVYQHYIHLTNALTKADMAEAKVAANAIEAGSKGLTEGNALATTASKISSASSVEAQREAYETMSNDMMKMVKKAGLSEGKVYVQYCPMAFNNKGASWLSATEEIKNPYMGEKMLSCGENRESIQ
jgi:hypothetical protein